MAIVLENAPADPVAAAARALVEAARASEAAYTPGALLAELTGALAALSERADEGAMSPADHMAAHAHHMERMQAHMDEAVDRNNRAREAAARADLAAASDHGARCDAACMRSAHHSGEANRHLRMAEAKSR
jgi:hypothetical protein